MSQPLVEFGTNSNWHQIYSETREITEVSPSGRTYIPIPAFEFPTLFESHILAVRTFSPTSPAHWRFSGMLRQRFQLGSGGVMSPLPEVDATAIRLTLNRTRLIVFPEFTSTYQLTLTPPTWVTRLTVVIWEYTGINSDTTERLVEQTRQDLVGIEYKIDDLLTRP